MRRGLKLGVLIIGLAVALTAYRDGTAGETTTVNLERLSVHRSHVGGLTTVDLVGAYNGHLFAVAGSVGALETPIKDDPFRVDVTVTAGGAKVTVAASIAQLKETKGVSLAITIKADSLAGLSGLAGTDLPAVGPIQASTTVSKDEETYVFEDLSVRVGRSDLSGTATIALGGSRPKVSARLAATLIDLADFTPQGSGPADSDASGPSPEESANDATRIFSADPLPLDALRRVDADVAIEADRLVALGPVLDAVNVTLNLESGRFRLRRATAQVADGTVSLETTVDAASDTPRVAASIEAKQVELGRLLRELDVPDFMTGGRTDIASRLTGQGRSVRALMAGLDGHVLVVVGEGRFHNPSLDLIGVALLRELVRRMNPFTEADEYTALECGVLRFDVKDGIATTDQGMAIQTTRTNAISTGTIDLKSEKLDLRIHPEARERFAVSAGVLTDLVRVGGTLAEPRLGADPKAIVRRGAEAGAALATGGLSLAAQALFRLAASGKGPCAIALGDGSAEMGGGEDTQAEGGRGRGPLEGRPGN